MSVSTIGASIQHEGNGASADFSFPYYFAADTELLVEITGVYGSAEIDLLLNVNYTVTGAGNQNGGSIDLSGGTDPVGNLPNGKLITITRKTSATQPQDYEDLDGFPADAHEEVVDNSFKLIQELQEEVSRCIKYSRHDPVASRSTSMLPLKNDRKGRFIGSDGDGVLTTYAVGDTITQFGTTVEYNSVAALQADNNISQYTTGQSILLKGYYLPGDFGLPISLIIEAAAATEKGSNSFLLADGRYANLYVHEFVNVKWFGAKGDGVTDDFVAINNSITNGTGLVIYFPAGHYIVSNSIAPTSNTVYTGDGDASKIEQTTANKNIFYIGGSTSNIKFYDLTFKVIDSSIDWIDGSGITIEGGTNIDIKFCHFTNQKHSAITLANCQYCKVTNNRFTNASVNDGDIDSSVLGADIFLIGSSSYNIITNNMLHSGAATAIRVRSKSQWGNSITNNLIANNNISNYKQFGIDFYADTISATSNLNTISNNIIDNITGTIDSASGNEIYGTGISVTWLDGVSVDGNRISNVCQSTNNDSLNPGGISIYNSKNTSVVNNSIKTSVYNGITIENPDKSGTDTFSIIANNKVEDITKIGISVKDASYLKINNNVIRNITEEGIKTSISTLTTLDSLEIINNYIKDCTLSSIEIDEATDISILNNRSFNAGYIGINVENSTRAIISNNYVTDSNADGIRYAGSSLDGILDNNTCVSNSSYDLFIQGTLLKPPRNNYGIQGGPSAIDVIITSTSPTLDIKGKGTIRFGPSSPVTITDLVNGINGQEVEIEFTNGNATFDFTGTNLKGNASVDKTFTTGEFARGTKIGTSWFFTLGGA